MGNIWQGSKVRVRAWEPDDYIAQMRWQQDTEGDRRTYYIPFPYSEAQTKQSASEHATKLPDDDSFRGIISLLDGAAVGVIGGNDCSRMNGTFSIAYYVEPNQRRKGYASDAVLILLRFYFLERRYQKANIALYEYNEPSQRLAEKLGFQLEGRQRRMQFSNGEYHDSLLYGLTVEEFRAKHAGWLITLDRTQ